MARCLKNFSIVYGIVLSLLGLLPALAKAQAVRGSAGDLWADKILGQTDFSQDIEDEVTASTLFHDEGVVLDNSHNILYVWDSANNRVLGISNFSSATSGQGADIVLGQADFTHSGSNYDSNWQTFDLSVSPNAFYSPAILPTANTLMGRAYNLQSTEEAASQSNMAVDPQGNLYVPDLENNRVLRFDYPVTTNEPASHVWGQVDGSGTPHFTYLAANNIGSDVPSTPTSTNLNFFPTNQRQGTDGSLPEYGAGVAIDPWGNLWVADAENNRVLRFPNPSAPSPGVPSTSADVVLGQNSFTANGSNGAGSYNNLSSFPILREPQAVRVDVSGNVYVMECSGYGGYGRISIFKPTGTSGGMPTYTIGEAASNSIVQLNGATSAGTGEPMGFEIDPGMDSTTQVGLWVFDHLAYQAYHYQVTWPTFSSTLLQNFSTTEYQGSPGIATNGDIYEADFRNNTVDHFPAGATTPDLYLFQSHGYGNAGNNPGPVGFREPDGVIVTVSSSGVTQIIGADCFRLHYWNMPAGGPSGLTNGAPEDGYAGTTTPYVFNNGLRGGYGQMAEDPSGNYLWVIDQLNSGARADAFPLPLPSTPQVNPALTVSSPLSVLGQTTQVSFSTLTGLTMDAAGNLWISDEPNSRVMRVRNPLTSPVVDIILGQPNASSTGTGRTQTTLAYPGLLKVDHHGDLFVADDWLEFIGNGRMMRYDAKSLPANPTSCVFGIPADGVYGSGGSFTAAGNTQYDSGFWEMAFNSTDSVMVAGTNSQWASGYPPVVIQNPRNGINPAGTPDIPGAGDNPVTHLNDYGPQSFSVNFDGNDNLYVVDLNRNRILVYEQPFTASTPTPTFFFTATFTPSSTPTSTPTGTWFSPTSTSTATLTATSTPTNSPTPSPTSTATLTATNSMTSTVTSSPTPTGSATPTPSVACCGVVWTKTTGSVTFNHPRGLETIGSEVFVADPDNNLVQVFGLDGTFHRSLAMPSPGRPLDLATDGTNLYVACDSGQKVLILNPVSGANVVTPLSDGVYYRGVAVDPVNQTVFASSGVDAKIHWFKLVSGSYVTQTPFGNPPFSGGTIPTGMVKTGSNLYVTNVVGNSIVQFSGSDSAGYTFVGQVTGTSGPTSVTSPYEMKMDASGRFFVPSDGQGKFTVFNQDWSFNSTCSNAGYGLCYGIAVDAGDQVYLSSDNGPEQIVRANFCLPTPSSTPTVTNTVSLTPTPTPTWSPTFTSTLTPTNSSTISPTATNSLTATPTNSPTNSFTLTATLTPTSSPTVTPTPTITSTPTEGCHDPLLYPNPDYTGNSITLHLPPCDQVRDLQVKVYTTAFRKVLEQDFPQGPPSADLSLGLTDNWGNPLANGLYYLVVDTLQGRSIQKLLVLR